MAKKIVINSSILNKSPSGLGVYAKNVIQELYKLNENVRVLSPVEIPGVEVEKINKYVTPSYRRIGGLVRLIWTQIVLPFKVKKDDLIYHPFQYLSLFSRAKQIITIHDFIPLLYPEVAEHQNKYYKYLMPILLKKAEKIVCISENTKSDLLNHYKVDESKVTVIYNGYDSKLFNIKNVDKNILKKYYIDYNYMILVGAAYPHKNLELALEAIKEMDNCCKLIIVGKDSKYILKLKKITEDLKIEDKVNFIGYVPDEDLPTLYHYSKCFIYPTLYEGFGLPILEAMACGTAVLCSNNSSLPEVYGEGALTFKNNDKRDLREKMSLIMEDENLRQALIDKSFDNIKRFSWQKTAEEVYELMKEEVYELVK